MKRSKRYLAAQKMVDPTKLYTKEEGIDLVLGMNSAKFDESLELHIKLGVDGRHADQQVRGVVVLPHGVGKKVRVLAIVKDLDADAAKEAGADFVGAEDVIEKIQKENWLDFDVCVTTPNMMRHVGKLGRVLGPKGLMPNPKSGTITTDIKKAVEEIKAGKVEYRLDKNNIVHVTFGKKSFGKEKLLDNLNVLLDAIVKAKPASSKGQYLKSISISSTMGPGVKLERTIAKK